MRAKYWRCKLRNGGDVISGCVLYRHERWEHYGGEQCSIMQLWPHASQHIHCDLLRAQRVLYHLAQTAIVARRGALLQLVMVMVEQCGGVFAFATACRQCREHYELPSASRSRVRCFVRVCFERKSVFETRASCVRVSASPFCSRPPPQCVCVRLFFGRRRLPPPVFLRRLADAFRNARDVGRSALGAHAHPALDPPASSCPLSLALSRALSLSRSLARSLARSLSLSFAAAAVAAANMRLSLSGVRPCGCVAILSSSPEEAVRP